MRRADYIGAFAGVSVAERSCCSRPAGVLAGQEKAGGTCVIYPLANSGADCNFRFMNFMPARSPPVALVHQRAEGRLDIALRFADGRTRLERFYQEGCLKARCVQAVRIPEIVSINISGGIAGGDVIHTKLQLEAGTCAVFTTQAAERVYRSLGEPAHITTSLTVGPGAHLTYLPQETILFDGFALDRILEVDLQEGAACVGVESLVFGRLAMGEALRSGVLRDRISVRREGRLIWRDVARIEGDLSAWLDQPGIGGKARASANLFAVGADMKALLPRLRDVLGGHVAGVSTQGEIMLLRLLAAEAATLRRAVVMALAVLRSGALPRVWQS